MRGGQEVIVEPSPDADERAVRLCLLGPIVALIPHQRGRLILHASAVAVGGDAIAFLGGQGWGKSTIAAALHVPRLFCYLCPRPVNVQRFKWIRTARW